MIRKSLIRKILIGTFWFLFLYSNLISRISDLNINALFYLTFGLLLLYYLKKFHQIQLSSWKLVYLSLITLSLIYVIDFRFDLSINLLPLKDILVPLLGLIIGYYMLLDLSYTVNIINFLYLPFISYGVFQALVFYSRGLEGINTMLPWDGEHIETILLQGVSNNFQGSLLRFFGTMNSFVEYQVLVVGVIFFIWLNISYLNNRKLFYINLGLMLVFLALSFERTPILFALLLYFIWQSHYLLSKGRFVFITATILIISLLFLFLGGSSRIKNEPLFVESYPRLIKILQLDFAADSALVGRLDNWDHAISVIETPVDAILGVGVPRVSPATSNQVSYLGPHNNYLVYYLGYGVLGFLLFLIFIFLGMKQILVLNQSYRFFGIGIVVSYLAMGMVNLPFVGKPGIIFFIIFGLLLSTTNQAKFRRIKRVSAHIYLSGENPMLNNQSS